jgi:hypothetical protein
MIGLDYPQKFSTRAASERPAKKAQTIFEWRPAEPLLLQLLRAGVVFEEFPGDSIGHIRARSSELSAYAFLRGGPDHVPVFVHETDGGYGFVLSLRAAAALAIAYVHTSILRARAACSSAAARGAAVAAETEVGLCMHAIAR